MNIIIVMLALVPDAPEPHILLHDWGMHGRLCAYVWGLWGTPITKETSCIFVANTRQTIFRLSPSIYLPHIKLIWHEARFNVGKYSALWFCTVSPFNQANIAIIGMPNELEWHPHIHLAVKRGAIIILPKKLEILNVSRPGTDVQSIGTLWYSLGCFICHMFCGHSMSTCLYWIFL